MKIKFADSPNWNELMRRLNSKYPGISDYICNEFGEIREYIVVFHNGDQITDPKLNESLSGEIMIVPSIAGG